MLKTAHRAGSDRQHDTVAPGMICVIIGINYLHITHCIVVYSGGIKGASRVTAIRGVIVFIASGLRYLTSFNNSIMTKILLFDRG